MDPGSLASPDQWLPTKVLLQNFWTTETNKWKIQKRRKTSWRQPKNRKEKHIIVITSRTAYWERALIELFENEFYTTNRLWDSEMPLHLEGRSFHGKGLSSRSVDEKREERAPSKLVLRHEWLDHCFETNITVQWTWCSPSQDNIQCGRNVISKHPYWNQLHGHVFHQLLPYKKTAQSILFKPLLSFLRDARTNWPKPPDQPREMKCLATVITPAKVKRTTPSS